jgi:hypothetical protein
MVQEEKGGAFGTWGGQIVLVKERQHVEGHEIDKNNILTFRRRNFLLNFSTSCI